MHDHGAMMELTIKTTGGYKTGTVSAVMTDGMPFGQQRYRETGTCTEPPALIAAFWDAVDVVLAQNGLNSSDFLRAVRAVDGDTVFGEFASDEQDLAS